MVLKTRFKRDINSSKRKQALKINWITDTHFYSRTDGDPESEDGLGAIYTVNHGEWHLYAGSAKFKQFVDLTNQSDCDFVVHTGDMVQDSDDETWNIFIDNWDNITKEKEFTIGNHDLMHGNSYNDVVSKVGYGDRGIIAGSVFNRSFSISNGVFDVRVIMADSNINNDGEHQGSGSGWFQQDLLDWIDSELKNCEENIVLIFTHHAPHLHSVNKFDEGQAYQYESIVMDAINNRGLTVHTFFGHHHPIQSLEFYSLNPNMRGISMGANILYNPGYFAELNVFQNGGIELKNVPVKYPY